MAKRKVIDSENVWNNPVLYSQVEEFIDRVYYGIYVISPDARKSKWGKHWYSLGGPLSYHLADALSLYSTIRFYPPSQVKAEAAMKAIMWISRAFGEGVIIQGSELPEKLRNAEGRIKELEKDNTLLTNKLKECQEEKDEIRGGIIHPQK